MADVIFECCCGIELEGVEDGGVVYVRCPVCGRRSKPIPIIGTVWNRYLDETLAREAAEVWRREVLEDGRRKKADGC